MIKPMITEEDFGEEDTDGNYDLTILIDKKQKQQILNAEKSYVELIKRIGYYNEQIIVNELDGRSRETHVLAVLKAVRDTE